MNESRFRRMMSSPAKRWGVLGLLFGLLFAGALLLPGEPHDHDACCPFHASAHEHGHEHGHAARALPDWPAETVLASVDGFDFTFGELRRQREGEATDLPPGAEICEAALLEWMIRRHLLAEAAQAKGLEETDAFRETLSRYREAPATEWMTEGDLEQRALAQAYLESEVIAKMDILPDDLEDMYEIFRPTLPEGMAFEDARPLLVNRLKRQAVERHIRKMLDRREVVFHMAWLEHVESQAQEAQNMPLPHGEDEP